MFTAMILTGALALTPIQTQATAKAGKVCAAVEWGTVSSGVVCVKVGATKYVWAALPVTILAKLSTPTAPPVASPATVPQTTLTSPPTLPPTSPATAPTTARATTAAPTTTTAGPKIFGVGETAQVGNWKIRVASFQLDATATVKEANQFNNPPPAGQQYVMLYIEAEWTGSGSETPRYGLVTSLATADGRLWPRASVVEARGGNGDSTEVGTGYRATAIRAFTIPTDQAGQSLTLVATDDSSSGRKPLISLRVN